MVDPARIEVPEVGRLLKDDIEGPLVLVSGPVVGDGDVYGRSGESK